MYKSEYRLFTVKLYPNATQVEIIENTLDACDKLWNHYLEKQVQPGFETLTRESPRIFEENKARKELTQMRQTEEFSYLSDIDRTALNQHLHRLDNAAFHARHNPNFFGRPKAKDLNANIRSYTSCVTSVDREKHTASIEIDQSRQMLKVPKLRWVKYRAGIIPYYDFQIKQVTIKSIHKQEYYGILLLEVFSIQLIPIMFNPVDVGIDLGLKHFATLSTGEKIPHFRYAREKLDTLIKLDCEMKAILNTNGKDSSEFAHIIRKIQRLHGDIANRRRNQINVVSWNLLNKFDILFIEKNSDN